MSSASKNAGTERFGKERLAKLGKEGANEVIDKILLSHKLSADPGDWKKSESKLLIDAFLECGTVIFGNCQAPVDFMKHYIRGKGERKHISLDDLFNEDQGARERVLGEIPRRHKGHETIREMANNARSSPSHGQRIDPVITIMQSNFTTIKWWGCLGTYNTRFIPASEAKDNFQFFQIEGSGIYMWHADRKGLSEKIHKMGVLLKEWNEASDFEMCGKPCVRKIKLDIISVGDKYKELKTSLHSKQINPNNVSSVNREYAVNVAKKYPVVATKYLGKLLFGE